MQSQPCHFLARASSGFDWLGFRVGPDARIHYPAARCLAVPVLILTVARWFHFLQIPESERKGGKASKPEANKLLQVSLYCYVLLLPDLKRYARLLLAHGIVE